MKNHETKLFEVRDTATCLPCVGIRLMGWPSVTDNQADNFLARRAGYAADPCVLFGRLVGGKFSYDPYEWRDRTMHIAHNYINKNWTSLMSGEVIDVEFILKETDQPKITERLSCLSER